MTADELGNPLALKVTAFNEQERARVQVLAQQVQEVTGITVRLAFLDQAYTGENAARQAEGQGIRLEVVAARR